MQAIGRQPQRAPDGAPVSYERHRPEQTTTTAWCNSTRPASSRTPKPVRQWSCPDSPRTSSTPSSSAASWPTACWGCAARNAATTSYWPSAASAAGSVLRAAHAGCRSAHLGNHVTPNVPVRQWLLSMPTTLRLLRAAQPGLITPVLQVVQRVLSGHLLGAAGGPPTSRHFTALCSRSGQALARPWAPLEGGSVSDAQGSRVVAPHLQHEALGGLCVLRLPVAEQPERTASTKGNTRAASQPRPGTQRERISSCACARNPSRPELCPPALGWQVPEPVSGSAKTVARS